MMALASTSAAQITQEQVEDFDRRWSAGWNGGDAEAVASICAPDVVFDDPALPVPALGRDEVRAFARAIFAAYPDFHIEVTAPPVIVPGTATVLSPYRVTGTMTGHLAIGNLAPSGARMAFHGVDEWTLADGLLAGYRTYYNSIGVARQLGILPGAGSAAEKLMARLQHLQARGQRRRNKRS
jgi:steroid delta-isomerase-like uncharacterized protein